MYCLQSASGPGCAYIASGLHAACVVGNLVAVLSLSFVYYHCLPLKARHVTSFFFFFLVQTWVSWQSPLPRWYSREFSELGIRAVHCYDCPTAQCGSGHDM